MKRLTYEPLAIAMGQELLTCRSQELAQFHPDLVVPIPMHWWRRLLRGVNNPELVAERLAAGLKIPLVRRLLVRCRHTTPQKNLLPRERFRNVRGAFRLARGKHLPKEGARVLLVDDILTTGATCSEAARVLKQAGAQSVVVAVLARAQGKT